MSGHSHFSSIKHKKAITDAKKSKVFSKMAREITLAAKEGGGDFEFNAKLRLAVERAKSSNMPKDGIERAIKRGTGEIEGAVLEEIVLEALGAKGVAIIIEGITDNKNRTLSEIKMILSQNNGKLGQEGAVQWMFEKKGVITVNKAEGSKNKEELELLAIESGAEDIYWHNDILDVYTKPEGLEKTKKAMEEKGIKPESASLDWVAKETITLDPEDKERAEKLFEALDENEAVQEIYSNIKV